MTLIGDAAHPMRSHLGQGGCQALIDAVVLARLIEQADTLPAAFAEFAARRRREVARAVRTSAALGRVIHWRGPVRQVIHNLVAAAPGFLVVRHTATIAGRLTVQMP